MTTRSEGEFTMARVLEWKVRDVPAEHPQDDQHKTEWRATFRDCALVVLRRFGVFQSWAERAGVRHMFTPAHGLRGIDDAKDVVVSAAVRVLDGREPGDQEYDELRLPLVEALTDVYTKAAKRWADAGLYGEELSALLKAERYRNEAEGLRSALARPGIVRVRE